MLGIGTLAKKVFGTPNDRKIKATRPIVEKINALEPEFQKLSDDEIKQKTEELAKRAKEGESLEDLLPEAFANCREAAHRSLGLRAFDVQLMGGIFLHQGNIAEMKTGEGKTLVATFPAYLNALTGKGVHIVTVNDYLAKRDADWMSKVYGALGMTTGVIYPQQPEDEKRAAYAADVTYATNNELGFDYLRDNMKSELSEMAQRGHNYAIVDEVDSILIDEARTPLIISGPSQDRSELYQIVDGIIPELTEEHYSLDEKTRNATFTEEGNEFLEQRLHVAGILPEEQSLYDPESTTIVHHINQALKAHKLFLRDKDYIVRNGEVMLIDEFTGRMMAGRRLSDGLHEPDPVLLGDSNDRHVIPTSRLARRLRWGSISPGSFSSSTSSIARLSSRTLSDPSPAPPAPTATAAPPTLALLPLLGRLLAAIMSMIVSFSESREERGESVDETSMTGWELRSWRITEGLLALLMGLSARTPEISSEPDSPRREVEPTAASR